MESEDLSGRELTIDSIMNKVRDIKINLTDELSLNKISADTTGELHEGRVFICYIHRTLITRELLTKL
uniref:TTK protein kinase n=1 Tax=Rhinopithecus bieti TaxID=61621 RepID=A0A2K6MJA9_RHIBE